jgi:hypothetical protein
VDLDKFFDTLALVPNLRSARFSDLEVTDLGAGEGFRFDGSRCRLRRRGGSR